MWKKIISTIFKVNVFYFCFANVLLVSALPYKETTTPAPLTTRTATTTKSGCPLQLDVAFAIDASYSVAPYFSQTLQLVKKFSSRVSVSKDAFRISLLQFSTEATVEFYLQNGTSLGEITRRVDAVKYNAGSTGTGLALQALREDVFTTEQGDRQTVPNLIILVTDGPASDHNMLISETQRLKESGGTTVVFAVSLGFLTDPQELRALAGSHVFSTLDLGDVGNLSETLVNAVCSVFGGDEKPLTSPSPPDKNTTRDNVQLPVAAASSTTDMPQALNDSAPSKSVAPRRTVSGSISSDRNDSRYIAVPNSQKDCEITTAVDLVLLVDSSKNVGRDNFQHIQSILVALLDKFEVDHPPGLHRVGIIQYSDDAVKVLPLGNVNSSEVLMQSVWTTRYIGGNSNLAAALNVMESEILTTPRDGVARIGIIITGGGLTTQRSLTRLHAGILRHNDVNVFLLGIGDQVTQDELSVLASQPEDQHVFTLTDVSSTNNFKVNETISSLCFGILKHTQLHANSSGRIGGSTSTHRDESTPPHNYHITDSHSDELSGQLSCRDVFDNCTKLTKEECEKDRTWALTNCVLHCGYCVKNDTESSYNSSKCHDSIPNCQDYGDYVCHDPSYKEWTKEHCSRYCRLCDENDKRIPATATKSNSSSQSNSTSNQDTACKDLLPDCGNYGGPSVCHAFRAWAGVRCRKYCGFCEKDNTTESPNVDELSGRCPQWLLPAQCIMRKVSWSQCPMPACPDGYVLTAIPRD